jgi:hypothetical protein
MKKIIAALVLAAAAASPTVAQEYIDSGLPNSGSTTFTAGGYGAFASAAPAQQTVRHSRAHIEMAPEMNVQSNQWEIIDR